VGETRFETDRIVETACASTGLDDFGEDTWQEGLERLTASLGEEARLNELGEQIVDGELVGTLSTRLALVDWRKQHPEIAGVPVVPPIVICGQARTGTTILFDLLAQDPSMRAPLTWEVDRPVPPPETATYDTDPRIDEVDAVLAGTELLIPGFRDIHPMGARLAQECVRMTASDFRSLIYPTQFRVPSYGHWIVFEADMAPAYRWHRRFLEHLQSRHPAGPDGAARWLIKSPAHLWTLGELLAEYPDALLVQTHRDPLRILASVSSLQEVLRRMTSDAPEIPDIAAEWVDYLVEGLDRSVTARQDGTVPADRIVDVQFADFMADPFVTIRTIYERLGLELSPESEQRMRDFLARHGQGEGGSAHRYTWADTGLDERAVRERTARYQEYFDVPSERLP
jgi:hypothetical protein